MSYQGKTACQVWDSENQPVMVLVFVRVEIIIVGLGCMGRSIPNPTPSLAAGDWGRWGIII
jgi:hypothetical protein